MVLEPHQLQGPRRSLSGGAQVNLDYESEHDMVEKMRIGLALQPLATALFANSPFRNGQDSGGPKFESLTSTRLTPGLESEGVHRRMSVLPRAGFLHVCEAALWGLFLDVLPDLCGRPPRRVPQLAQPRVD